MGFFFGTEEVTVYFWIRLLSLFKWSKNQLFFQKVTSDRIAYLVLTKPSVKVFRHFLGKKHVHIKISNVLLKRNLNLTLNKLDISLI